MHYSENGLAQGCVSFRAVEEKDGVIARMTVEKGTGLKQVSEVNFVNTENWPENDAIPVYQEGMLYKFGLLDDMEALGYSWKPGGFFSSGTNNMEFLLNGYDEKENEIKCLDLDKKVGKICNVSCSLWNQCEYRYMHIRIFPPATKVKE